MTLLAKQPFVSALGTPTRGPRGLSPAATLFTTAAALLPAMLWVGDISWSNDEAELIAQAWFGDNAHVLVQRGLAGNFSISYGPLPTQIYQFLLLLTRDPIRLAQLRAGLCAGTVALSLLWLARSLKFNLWFAAGVVLAPYIWMFNRLVWDASFAMPLGALAVAAYAAYLRHGSGRWLLLAGGCALCLPFIHPQDLPLTAAMGGHILWRQRAALRRHAAGVLLVVAVVLAINCIYLRDIPSMLADRLAGSFYAGYPGATERLPSFLAPLMAGRLLAGNMYAQVDAQLKYPHGLAPLLAAVKVGSCIIFPLMWAGIVVAGWRLWGHRRSFIACEAASVAAPADERGGAMGKRIRLPVEADRGQASTLAHATRSTASARDALGGIALAALVMQSVLYGVMRVPAAPQYFFGPFALDVLLAWIGVDALRRVRGLQWAAITVYCVCGAAITLPAMWQIHRIGYARNTQRPTFANQLEVARELNRYSDDSVLTDVVPYFTYDRDAKPLRCLRLLTPPPSGHVRIHSGRLVIRYASGPEGNDCLIELIEAAKLEDIPPGAKPTHVSVRARR